MGYRERRPLQWDAEQCRSETLVVGAVTAAEQLGILRYKDSGSELQNMTSLATTA